MGSAGAVMGTYEQDDEGYIRSPKAMKHYKAERKVIEAAKAYKHGWHNGQNMDVLRDALFETLQKLEKGDER